MVKKLRNDLVTYFTTVKAASQHNDIAHVLSNSIE